MSTDLKEMITAIDRAIADDTFNLLEKEAEFLEKMRGFVDWGVELTDGQDRYLESIWKRATG